MSKRIGKRHIRIIASSFGVVAVVIALKIVAHLLGLEVLSLNPLLAGIVGADIFLMGFLLSGVMGDFKESEKLPGEVAGSLEVMYDEAERIARRAGEGGPKTAAESLVADVRELAASVRDWFYKRQKTATLMSMLSAIGPRLDAVESPAQAGSTARIRQEQHGLRRTIIRIHSIRETSFISCGYLIAWITTALLSLALILSKMDPFYESLFIVGVIVFLLAFLLLLIADLDNPFGYYDKASSQDVSLEPLEDALERISAKGEARR